MSEPPINTLATAELQTLMGPQEYHMYILLSFLFWAFIHHLASRWIFRNNPAYCALSKNKRMEWDSRFMSTIHATIVSILCVVSLVKENQLWADPFFGQGRIGLMAMCISIGYFTCDLISMPIYYDRKNMAIFTLHHLVATIAFYLILDHRVGLFFGVYRLTTELSTPFTNQRWFYRKVGYTLDRRRVAIVSLIFSIFFVITRNLMILPYWAFVYNIFGSEGHVKARVRLPGLDISWFFSSLILDALNIYWAIMVYPIGINAAIKLYKADWKTDFDRARDKLRDRFTSARRRAMTNELINRLRRTASFSRIQRAWEDLKVFPGEFGTNGISSMAMSERSSPILCFSDSDDDDDAVMGELSKRGSMLAKNHIVSDDEVDSGLTTEADLFYTGVTGSSAFVAAVTVAIKQLKYDTSSNTLAQNLYKYSPLLFLLVVLFLQLFGVICCITFFYSTLGLLFGWTYLRFFQRHTDGKRGDFRLSFAFVSFFPRLVQPLIAILVNFIYAVFVALKLCPKIEQQYEILSASSFSRDVPTVSFSDNERHKRIALHDLNTRLAKKHEPLEQWPSLFDEEGHSPPPDASLVQTAPPSSPQPSKSFTSAKDDLPDV
nr:transmembrane protein 56 [Hymenolepis microstoma]